MSFLLSTERLNLSRKMVPKDGVRLCLDYSAMKIRLLSFFKLSCILLQRLGFLHVSIIALGIYHVLLRI